MVTEITQKVYKDYYSEKERVDLISKYEKKEIDKMIFPDGSVPHGVLKNGLTIFDSIDLRKTMVAESKNFIAIIPAGFRDCETFNTMNPVKETIGGLRALMSIIHVIIVPKAESGIRITNAVTMDKIHHKWLITEMEELGTKAVRILINGNENMPGSVRWQLSQRGKVTMKDNSIQDVELKSSDFRPSCQESFISMKNGHLMEVLLECNENICHSFHLDKEASISKLHMHCYIKNLLTTAHDRMEEKSKEKGRMKNTSSSEIIMMINRGIEDIYDYT